MAFKKSEIRQEIKSLYSQIAEVDISSIQDQTHFVKDLKKDSMASLELLTEIEKKFKIEIDSASFPKILMVQNAVDLILSIIESRDSL